MKSLTNCVVCNKELEHHPNSNNRNTCSYSCSREWNGTSPTIYKHLNNSTVGYLAEQLVCNDLLKRGFEVYRASSPSTSHDLVVEIGGSLVKIDVTSGRKNMSGKVFHVPKPNKNIAIVLHKTNEIIYEPEIF